MTLRERSASLRVPLAVALLLALVCWPLRDALVTGTIAGAGPDVASTMWAMWWFSQEWASAAWGGHTDLVNYPAGAYGAVLSPLTAVLWSLLAAVFGEMAATTWTDILYLLAFIAAVAAVAHATGLSRPWAMIAGAMVLVPRYPIFALGETSLVGITGLTVPLGIYGLYRGGTDRRWDVVFAVCVALTGIEMPYLVPVLPLVALVRFRRRGAMIALVAGVVGLALIGSMHVHSQSGDFGMMNVVERVHLGGWKWMVIEAPWARSTLQNLVVPGPVRWSMDAQASQQACGRDYVGASVLALSAVSLWLRPAQWPWVLFGVGGMALATGSDWFGYPAPFALLNALWWRLVRGLTQPTRYLLLPAIGFAVAAAHTMEAAWFRNRAMGAVILAAVVFDGFALGGLSLRLPTMAITAPVCVKALRTEGEGGVLLWPWDGLRSSDGIRQRLLQIAHHHPTSGFGVGSWKLEGVKPAAQLLEDLRLPEAARGTGTLNVRGLRALGFRWVIVDLQASSAVQTRSWFGAPIATCDGLAIHKLK